MRCRMGKVLEHGGRVYASESECETELICRSEAGESEIRRSEIRLREFSGWMQSAGARRLMSVGPGK